MSHSTEAPVFDKSLVYYTPLDDKDRHPWEWIEDNCDVYPHNNHMMRVAFNGIDADIAEKCINGSITIACRYAKSLGCTNLSTERYINIIRNRSGQAIGLAYLWLVDSRIFNVLSDMNPDGSMPYEIEDHPDYVEPEIVTCDSWADVEDERDPDTYIRVWKPRYSGVMGYKYTAEEVKLNTERLAHKHHCTVDELTEQQLESMPKGNLLRIEPYFPDIPDDCYSTNILVGSGLPKWLTTKMILAEVGKFTTTTHKVTCKFSTDRSTPGRSVKWCTITYDPNTYDAVFAVAMKKIIKFSKANKNGKVDTYVLFLNLANAD